ncbi:trypco2 family protein [Phytomonospora sp. NPDC050363]|uniref:trypco2 family protein n=1 Tax=Phytomonospora sp. NPDC050363 TaxID=3155642 RepID=UPI003409F666
MDNSPTPTIADVVAEIRRQLLLAQKAAKLEADESGRVRFAIAEAEADLGLEAVVTDGKVRLRVISGAVTGAETVEAAHHLKIRLEARSKAAGLLEVSDDGEDDY